MSLSTDSAVLSLQLAYADTAKTINEFGTGLGGLPGTSVQEMFVSFGEKGALQVFEVCRIVGPFPSVRNKLDGTFDFKKRAAGFAGERVEEEGLSLKYTQLTDGRDKVASPPNDAKCRARCRVRFALLNACDIIG